MRQRVGGSWDWRVVVCALGLLGWGCSGESASTSQDSASEESQVAAGGRASTEAPVDGEAGNTVLQASSSTDDEGAPTAGEGTSGTAMAGTAMAPVEGSSRSPTPGAVDTASGPAGGDFGAGGGSDSADAESLAAGDTTAAADGSEAEAASEPPATDADLAEEPPSVQSGVLTAGAWDDNRNFNRFSEYRSELLQAGLQGALPLSDAEHAEAYEAFGGVRDGAETLDVALVIDTTGSMGDELVYLQQEIQDIATAIDEKYPDAVQRWALVLYRDQQDAYETRAFDFDEQVSAFRANLAMQSAAGGGDYPEASHAALAAMNGLAWRDDSQTARLAFWVADAPHHADKADALAEAIREARAQGVHLYPVASSGVDTLTELTMRSAAQFTGGRYLFLTDDSGVGGAHKEPSIPCYFVTRLDQALIRMVDIELSGMYREPTADQVIRTGGEPDNGSCVLASGEQVQAF